MNGCAAAVTDAQGAVLAARGAAMNRGQAEVLVPMIDEVVTAAGGYGTIDLIAVTRGPGAFTGIRIGLSTARALGLALGRPVAGVSTLDCLAAAYYTDHPQGGNVLALIETKREDFYGQFFVPGGQAQGEPFACPAVSVPLSSSVTIIGDAGTRFAGLRSEAAALLRQQSGYELPRADIVARAGLRAHESGTGAAAPLYLRGADVSASTRFTRTVEE